MDAYKAKLEGRMDISKQSTEIVRNAEHSIVYHRGVIYGDYDLLSEDTVLKLLRACSA